MGICGSKQPGRKTDLQVEEAQLAAKHAEQNRSSPTRGIVKFGLNDMVSQNTNDIKKEYSLLSPPLGKGAYGEVRKAKHIKTGIYRACKIISKKDSDPNEQKKFIEEIMKIGRAHV